jgi:alpha-N-arabinofuranosidase
MSEGGTEYGHMLTLFRSTDPYGPFEACPFNPILTNRNLGGYKIQGAGHADLTHDEQGNWWLVHLAFRQIDKWKPFHHLGREVFLQPVSWTKDGWIKTGVDGTSRIGYTKLDGKWSILNEDEQKQQIWQPNQKEACFLRRPDYSLYRFENNRFYLKGTIDTLDGIGNPTFLGIRQKEFDCIMSCSINGQTMTIGQEAGLSVYMRENNHYDLLVEKEDNNYYIKLILKIGEHGFIINSINLNHSDIKLKITANAGIYMFYAKGDQDDYTYLGRAETKYLSSEVAEGFTGVILAAYCVADKEGKSGWVEYQLIE